MDIILSFIVVTHNHSKCIKRCIDSILMQEINDAYEIIVGDDNSQDGTWDILSYYAKVYQDKIIIYRTNSDEINPLSLSDRASHNRAIGYRLSRGRFYTEIDGDDFLLPGKVYQKQLDLLKDHEECSLCMQNMSILKEGDEIENRHLRFNPFFFKNEQVLSAEDYISHPEWFSQHQSFVFRKQVESPIDKLGLDYEDTTVTLFHLRFGSIIFLDYSAYVYVSYGNGINASLSKDDRKVALVLLQIEHCLFFPEFSELIVEAHKHQFNHLFKCSLQKALNLSDSFRKSLIRYHGFVFDYYQATKHSFNEKLHLFALRIITWLMIRSNNNKILQHTFLRLAI